MQLDDAMKNLRDAEQEALRETERAMGLERAFDTMWMAFQPIVDRSGTVFGYEALMRTTEPTLPHPGAVIEAAERAHRLPELGRRVRALTAREFRTAPSDVHLFVNLIPSDLFDDTFYGDDGPLSAFAGRVVLEITERGSIKDLEGLDKRIESLRAKGFEIAVDDLGAGYAGLTSFALLRPDVAKIDMTLVRNVDSDPVRQRLITSIVKLCDDLGVKVVAEGIETKDERDTVRALGVHLFQGYYIARPGRGLGSVHW